MKPENTTAPAGSLVCRICVTFETWTGKTVIETVHEEVLEHALMPAAIHRLAGRAHHAVSRCASKVRLHVDGWVEESLPQEPESFEAEFCRRCDHNEQVIDALKFLTGDELTDEEREWQCRVVEIMLARGENYLLQRP